MRGMLRPTCAMAIGLASSRPFGEHVIGDLSARSDPEVARGYCLLDDLLVVVGAAGVPTDVRVTRYIDDPQLVIARRAISTTS